MIKPALALLLNRGAVMSQKVRNGLALGGLVIYIILLLVWTENPAIRYYGIIAVGLYEIGLSGLYCFLNRPMKPNERTGEIVADVIILVAVLYAVFRVIA
jgi:hypothetical protein